MTKAEKLLARMRANPRDWRIEDLETVAKRHVSLLDEIGTEQ